MLLMNGASTCECVCERILKKYDNPIKASKKDSKCLNTRTPKLVCLFIYVVKS